MQRLPQWIRKIDSPIRLFRSSHVHMQQLITIKPPMHRNFPLRNRILPLCPIEVQSLRLNFPLPKPRAQWLNTENIPTQIGRGSGAPSMAQRSGIAKSGVAVDI